MEAGRQYADHVFWNTVHANLLADHMWVGVEALPPIEVSQNGDVVSLIGGLRFRESAPECGPDTEGGEKLRRHYRDLPAFRGAGFTNNPGPVAIHRERGQGWNGAAAFVGIG